MIANRARGILSACLLVGLLAGGLLVRHSSQSQPEPASSQVGPASDPSAKSTVDSKTPNERVREMNVSAYASGEHTAFLSRFPGGRFQEKQTTNNTQKQI
jgi:hypothetical protein